MTTDANPYEPKSLSHEVAVEPKLRWWPALVLVIVSWLLRLAPMLGQSFAIIMLSMFGPLLASLLIAIWWLGFSRARLQERLLMAGGFLVIAAIAIFSLHFSLFKGMSIPIAILPWAAVAFGVACIVSASWHSESRMPFVLAATALTFGYFETLQLTGISGTFQPSYLWRWEPTPEETYLAERKKGAAAAGDSQSEETITTAEWPEFRGPQRDGRMPGVAFAENWDQQAPKQIWKRMIGPGWSSFAVVGSRLYTQEQRGDDEAVVCLNANTGIEIWSYTYKGRFWESVAGAGPRATPTFSEGSIYAFGAEGMLVRLDARTGKVAWDRNVAKDTGVKPPMWGFSSSPLVTEGVVIVHVGDANKNGYVAAYDAGSGEKKWSTKSGDHSYCSAQIATFDGVMGVLMMTNMSLQFLSPTTGELIWDYPCEAKNYRALQPLVFDQSVLIATGMGNGTKCVEVSHESNEWKFKEKWDSKNMKCDFNDFVKHKDSLYGFDGDLLGCIDLETGKRRWKGGRYGKGQVLLLPDADQLLVLAEFDGIALVKASPSKFQQLAKIPGITGKTWNHPVVVGNRLYVRNAEEAACYEIATMEGKAANAAATEK